MFLAHTQVQHRVDLVHTDADMNPYSRRKLFITSIIYHSNIESGWVSPEYRDISAELLALGEPSASTQTPYGKVPLGHIFKDRI